MKLLVAATLAALIQSDSITAAAAVPVFPPLAQTGIQQGDQCQPRRAGRRVHRGHWRHRGMWFHHRQWRCRFGRCRWYHW